jgi:hypothetical protein
MGERKEKGENEVLINTVEITAERKDVMQSTNCVKMEARVVTGRKH